jgi:hypothetical protein
MSFIWAEIQTLQALAEDLEREMKNDVRTADGRRRVGVEVDAKTGAVVSVEDDGDSGTQGPADPEGDPEK